MLPQRRLLRAPGALLTPVPYDFDYSGLVDAPYAVPPEGIPVENVRQRNYRGYCAHMAQARAIAAQLSPRRAEFSALFATIPGLEPRDQARPPPSFRASSPTSTAARSSRTASTSLLPSPPHDGRRMVDPS